MDASENIDHEFWRHWFQRHGPRLLVCARQWTRTMDDAEDIVQEAFVKFWRRQQGLDGDPIGLVLLSIRRAAIDRARREDRRTVREQKAETLEPTGMPERLFERVDDGDERRMAIEAALQRLPDEQRETLVLKIWGERTFEQIATALEISPNTAASRYRYALKALRRELSSVECP